MLLKPTKPKRVYITDIQILLSEKVSSLCGGGASLIYLPKTNIVGKDSNVLIHPALVTDDVH